MAVVQSVHRSYRRLATTRRSYRLINGYCEPHPQLDGDYQSLDEAIGDVIDWLLSNRLLLACGIAALAAGSALAQQSVQPLPKVGGWPLGFH